MTDKKKEMLKSFMFAAIVTTAIPTIKGISAGVDLSERIYRVPRDNKLLGRFVTGHCLALCGGTGVVVNAAAFPLMAPIGLVAGVKNMK